MHKSIKVARTCAATGLVAAALAACNGGSGPSGLPSADGGGGNSTSAVIAAPTYPRIDASSGATTTLGTRLTLSANNPALTGNANLTWRGYGRNAEYPGVVALPLQFITTRSGQKLGVLVTLPADAHGNAATGPFPAILGQTAYRANFSNAIASLLPAGGATLLGGADRYMIRRGYATVVVDALGTGVSSGQADLWGPNEQAGYADAVAWVMQQSWSNGKIGVAGTSYLGISALLTAAQRHPAVKAAFVSVPMGDAWRGVLGTGGLINALLIPYWLPMTEALSIYNQPQIKDYPQYADQIRAATQDHIDAMDGFFLPMIHNAIAGVTGYGTDDGDFWATRSPLEHAKNIQVPTFVIGASIDAFQRDEPLLYELLKRKVPAKLVIVPGAHAESILSSLLGNNNPAQDGAPGSARLLLQWFDKYIKELDSGAEKQPNVTQYVLGYDDNGIPRYTTATDWPHPQAIPQRLYLHGDLTLTTQPPGASETTHTVAEPPAPTLTVGKSKDGTLLRSWLTVADGSDKSVSYFQWSLGFVLPLHSWYKEDNTVETAQKAINFETAPMTESYFINGPMQADIWMSSTATEAALSVRVDDVEPDGTARPLANGMMSAAHRAVDASRSRYLHGEMIQPWHPFTLAAKQPLTPGTPGTIVKVPVEIFPIAAVIKPGHKLRVSISASNQAQGIWPTPSQALANGGVTTLYNDAAHPSSVVLPVLPNTLLQ